MTDEPTTEEIPAAEELEGAEEVEELRAPVESLTEPVEEVPARSILDSVLYPDEEEGVPREKLNRKFYEKELRNARE